MKMSARKSALVSANLTPSFLAVDSLGVNHSHETIACGVTNACGNDPNANEDDPNASKLIFTLDAISSNGNCSLSKSDVYETLTHKILCLVQEFYRQHPEIKISHGWEHVKRVFDHACKAIESHQRQSHVHGHAIHSSMPRILRQRQIMEIQAAALLHDVDDSKYFPTHSRRDHARALLQQAAVSAESIDRVLEMIHLVSCSANGNHVPEWIVQNHAYFRLYPRWADRLEAVGAVGVVRCYQYNQERGYPLSSKASPKCCTPEQVWKEATPERFLAYQNQGGQSTDMISHYYDKLLHVACPPADVVRNEYLETQARESSKELLEMCIRYGRAGKVDENYIQEMAESLGIQLT